MSKRSMNKKIWSAIGYMFLLAAAYVVFTNQETVAPNTATPQAPSPTVEAATTTNFEGGYFKVYFTTPPLGDDEVGIESHLIELINESKTSIHAAIYELDIQDVVDALVSAKQRGVDVGIVYDNGQVVGKENRIAILKQLNDVGILTVPDKRDVFMHNKFFVFDGKIVWTGSFNITNNARHLNNENAVEFDIPMLAQNYEKEFGEMNNDKLFGPKSPSDTPNPIINIDGHEIETYFAPEDKVMEKIIAEVKQAKNSIDFLSYSFTDDNLAYSMSELALNDDLILRGVFDAGQDMGDSVCPYLISRDQNIEGNGDIQIKIDGNPKIMHEKVIVIDEETVIFGSFNYSNQANKSNDENLLIVHDPAFAKLFEQEFQKVLDLGVIPNSSCKKNK